MALGRFRFAVDTAAFQRLSHRHAYRWPSQERLGRRPARQFVGLGEETLELSGVIYPHFRGGLQQVAQMRELASQGNALLLTDGLGVVWGQWVILQIQEGQSFFQANGMPFKQTFELSLGRYGEDNREV